MNNVNNTFAELIRGVIALKEIFAFVAEDLSRIILDINVQKIKMTATDLNCMNLIILFAANRTLNKKTVKYMYKDKQDLKDGEDTIKNYIVDADPESFYAYVYTFLQCVLKSKVYVIKKGEKSIYYSDPTSKDILKVGEYESKQSYGLQTICRYILILASYLYLLSWEEKTIKNPYPAYFGRRIPYIENKWLTQGYEYIITEAEPYALAELLYSYVEWTLIKDTSMFGRSGIVSRVVGVLQSRGFEVNSDYVTVLSTRPVQSETKTISDEEIAKFNKAYRDAALTYKLSLQLKIRKFRSGKLSKKLVLQKGNNDLLALENERERIEKLLKNLSESLRTKTSKL